MSMEEHLDNALAGEFSGHGDTIHKLKTTNAHFRNLMEKNHELFVEIKNIQAEVTPTSDETLRDLEKKRLALLDEIGTMISVAEK